MLHNFLELIFHRCRLGGKNILLTYSPLFRLFQMAKTLKIPDSKKCKTKNKKTSDAVLQAFCFPLPSSYGIVFFTFAFYFISLLPIFSIAPPPLYKNDNNNNKINNLRYELPSHLLSSLFHCLNYLLLPLSSITFPSFSPFASIFMFFIFCSCQTE